MTRLESFCPRTVLRRGATLTLTIAILGSAGAAVLAGHALLSAAGVPEPVAFAPRTMVNVMKVDLTGGYTVTRRFTGQVEAAGQTVLALFNYPFGINAINGVIGSAGVSINAALIVLSGLRRDARASAGDRAEMVDVVAGSARHITSTTITTFGGFVPLEHQSQKAGQRMAAQVLRMHPMKNGGITPIPLAYKTRNWPG